MVGCVIKFNYGGSHVRDPHPRVLILGTQGNLVHGINLRYLSDTQQQILKEVFNPHRINLFFGITNASEFVNNNMKIFYSGYLKRYIDSLNIDCYRTYNKNKMSMPEELENWLGSNG